MVRTLLQIKEKSYLSPFSQPQSNYFLNQLPPPSTQSIESNMFDLNNKVSPTVLLIIIILAIIFFISGLLHLLVRFLLRPSSREPDELDSVTALQGQLQQLFNLHDSGVDQSFIDTLPVFTYKAIIGVKDPFDCAVCLCEFEGEDKLRLLPKCSHAFHMECIDTWLLSHSTCPLCRACLLQDFSPSNNCSPIVFVLESGSTEISREIGSDSSVARVNSQVSNEELRVPLQDLLRKSCDFQVKEVENQPTPVEKVVQVKLGKFKNVDLLDEGSSNNSRIDSRRCFSMGAFAYVMDDNTSLKVPIIAPVKKTSTKKNSLPLIPGHRAALSECGWDSRREFNGLDAFKILEQNDVNKGVDGIKRESSSASKPRVESSRRAFSFRFPLQGNMVAEDEVKAKHCRNGERRAASEVGFDRWENGFDDLGCDEIQSFNSFASQPNAPSFARRTLQWLMRKPNKVEQSNSSSNV